MKLHFSSRLFLSLLLLCFSLSSCFDFKEEITIQANGSGSFHQTVDMGDSPMIQMLKAFAQADSSKSESASNASMAKMDSSMQENEERLSKIKGISNIKVLSDKENFKFDISYDFANIDALNEAIASKEEKNNAFYSFKKGQLKRLNTFDFGDNELMGSFGGDKSEETTDEESKQAQELVKAMFADSNYELIIHVPNKIKSYTNKENAFLSEDKKTLKVKIPLADLFDKKTQKSLETLIKFK